MENLVKQGQPRTVITASTGNHAQSVAYAGRLFGVEVKIVMPHGVPQLKSDAAKDLGAELLFHGSYYDEAREYGSGWLRRMGTCTFILAMNRFCSKASPQCIWRSLRSNLIWIL